MDSELVRKVWEKGLVVLNNDSGQWRKDECGAWIGWGYYGDRNSQYGWEIDHINPTSNQGTDNINNLRPLQWENNLGKRDGRLICIVKSSGTQNEKVN